MALNLVHSPEGTCGQKHFDGALAVGRGGHLRYYQHDNRAISYTVGSIFILASLYLTFARKYRR